LTQREDLHRTPTAIALADFNHDQKLDLAVSLLLDRILIFSGDGLGRFTAGEPFDPGDSPTSLAPIDLNHDGHPDLLIADNGEMQPGIAIYRGIGDGRFEKSQFYKTRLRPLIVSSGDYNGDGVTDLVVIYSSQSTMAVFLGRSDGTFQDGMEFGSEGGPTAVLTGDYDHDGKQDILTTNDLTGKFSISFGKGDGTFVYPPSMYRSGDGPFAVVTGKFNKESSNGLAIANNVSNTVSIFLAKEHPSTGKP
jgi:hypothetical protein